MPACAGMTDIEVMPKVAFIDSQIFTWGVLPLPGERINYKIFDMQKGEQFSCLNEAFGINYMKVYSKKDVLNNVYEYDKRVNQYKDRLKKMNTKNSKIAIDYFES